MDTPKAKTIPSAPPLYHMPDTVFLPFYPTLPTDSPPPPYQSIQQTFQQTSSQGLECSSPCQATVPPLQIHEVRWFHMRTSKYWQPFCGGDSLKLEVMYQTLPLLDDTTPTCVDVMGDLYEANVKTMTCTAIYWSEKDAFKILRGTWFEVQGDKWYPLEEDEALSIEKKHCDPEWRAKDKETGASLGGGQTSSLKSQQAMEIVIARMALEKCEVIWMAGGDVYKLRKDFSTFVLLKVGEAIGKGASFSGTCLRRGYRESAVEGEQTSPIGHLVLVVHGIGENLSGSPISKRTTDFRETCMELAMKYFPEQWNEKRVEFLPIDWRTCLTLDDGMLKKITGDGIKSLREFLNGSLLEVLYYTNQTYGQEILSGLHSAINKQYRQFIKHHPHFHEDGGTVSVIAHSLGSVIMYDLLQESCRANNIRHDKPLCKISGEAAASTSDSPDGDGGAGELRHARLKRLHALRREAAELERLLGVTTSPNHVYSLDFKVEHLFLFGSPLGMFILMREHESLVKRGHRSSASLVPTEICKRIHNIYHPSDPEAYRLEPLIIEAYASIKPVKVDSAGSKPSKTALDHAKGPKTDEKLTAPSGQSGSWMSSLMSVFTNPAPEPKQDKDKQFDSDSYLPPADRLKERLDFSLQEGMMDISYVNALTSRSGYWTSADCAFYVLLQIFTH